MRSSKDKRLITITKHDPDEFKYEYESNKVAGYLKLSGVICIILGLIAGISLARISDPILEETYFSISLFLGYFAGGTLMGVFFIGIGEIINTLHEQRIDQEVRHLKSFYQYKKQTS
ncbi:hypothetical protein [Halobacillus aidingensis]|uniref:Uncharacterized protein n=1 Tax=Halobacillus aidingensis TaxID=240303 RepID=A0A1H0MDW1_HALAD|nr:hypothetical protein [Halobacillus aidingensis]SDO78456.1 hypothetical protein SAMN05421677_1082 [Halobacillus aidingensis]